jgi:hypothetical protein
VRRSVTTCQCNTCIVTNPHTVRSPNPEAARGAAVEGTLVLLVNGIGDRVADVGGPVIEGLVVVEFDTTEVDIGKIEKIPGSLEEVGANVESEVAGELYVCPGGYKSLFASLRSQM